MLKIEKVISDCCDCHHCKIVVSQISKHTKAIVCAFEDEGKEFFKPFLLEYTESSGSSELPIPDNCPLEDYKEIEK